MVDMCQKVCQKMRKGRRQGKTTMVMKIQSFPWGVQSTNSHVNKNQCSLWQL